MRNMSFIYIIEIEVSFDGERDRAAVIITIKKNVYGHFRFLMNFRIALQYPSGQHQSLYQIQILFHFVFQQIYMDDARFIRDE